MRGIGVVEGCVVQDVMRRFEAGTDKCLAFASQAAHGFPHTENIHGMSLLLSTSYFFSMTQLETTQKQTCTNMPYGGIDC
jgi:hypothetical protein